MKPQPIEKTVIPMPQAPTERKAISQLAQLLLLFKPTLVNESPGKEPEWNGEYEARDPRQPIPTIHELVTASGNAIVMMKGFISHFEDLKKRYAAIYDDGLQAHIAIRDIGIKAGSLAEAFQQVIDRHKQALSVIQHIGRGPHDNYEQAKILIQAATKFCDDFDKRISEVAADPVKMEHPSPSSVPEPSSDSQGS